MNPVIGWILAAAAVVAGYMGYGWPGVVLALTVITFWLLLQFSRAMRVMRAAAGRPVGHVASAVMLQSRLKPGMRLAQVMGLTGSFGQRLSEPGADPERYRWTDEGGAAVEAELRGGRLVQWQLVRGAAPGQDPAA